MSNNVAHAIRPRIVQDWIAVIRSARECEWSSNRAFVQFDVQLTNVLQRSCGDPYGVRPIIILRQVDKLVPYSAELVLEVGESISVIEAAK
jgi:hypothetical protein